MDSGKGSLDYTKAINIECWFKTTKSSQKDEGYQDDFSMFNRSQHPSNISGREDRREGTR